MTTRESRVPAVAMQRRLGSHFGGGLFRFAEHVADAANLCADAAKFFFDALIAAIDVIHAVDDCFALGDQSCQHQRRRGAQIGCHHSGRR